jgi:hypothetical protein
LAPKDQLSRRGGCTGEKRDFRCDCGNEKFSHAGRLSNQLKCCLEPAKERANPRNRYNHNFAHRWCYCDGEEVLPMFQVRPTASGYPPRMLLHLG